MATVQGSWSISGTTATYLIAGGLVTAFTLKSLPSGTAVNKYGKISGIEVLTSEADGGGYTGSIEFDSAVLGTSKITFTAGKGFTYNLELADGVEESEIVPKDPTISNGTLTIMGDITAGYKADSTGVSYTAAQTNQKLVSVSGLDKTLTAEDYESYISVSDSTITLLSEDAIAEDNNGNKTKVSLSNGKGNYVLAIDESNLTAVEDNEPKVTVDTAKKTATVTTDQSKGYSCDGKSVTYTAAKENVVLATVTGLKAEVPQSAVTLDEKVIKIGEGALGTSKISLSTKEDYTLALEEDKDEDGKIGFEEEHGYWVVDGSKATYKQDVDEGWTTDGKSISYTKANTLTLATVSGLLKGFVPSGIYKWDDSENTFILASDIKGNDDIDGVGDETKLLGIVIDETEGIITLDKRALGTSKVTVGAKENYTLALENEGDYKVDGEVAETNCWVVSGTTATYKKAVPAFYTKATDGKSVTYTATSKGTTLATVKGIAKDLFVGTNTEDSNKITEIYKKDGDDVKVVMTVTEPADDEPGVITLYDGAQGTSNITVGAKENYILKLNKDDKSTVGAPIAAAHVDETDNADKIKWTVKSGTASLSGVLIGGFTESSDGKTLVYTKSSTQNRDGSWKASDNIVQIKGLAKKDSAGDSTDGTYDGLKGLEDLGIKVEVADSETGNGITTITVAPSAMGDGNVTVTNTAYRLTLGTDNTTNEEITILPKNEAYLETNYPDGWEDGLDVWRVSGTTAVYEKVIPAYYTYDEAKNTIVYHKETVVKDPSDSTGKKDLVYATITGFDKGKLAAAVNGDEITGIEVKEGTKGAKIITFTDTSLFPDKDGSKITLDAKKSQSNYSMTVESYGQPIVDDGSIFWSFSGTTATLKGNMSEGWSVTSNLITKLKAADKTVLATIKGLNGGLVVDKDDETLIGLKDAENAKKVAGGEDGAKIKISGTVIRLDEDALDKKDVTIESTAGYTLSISSDLIPKEGEDKGWTVSGTTATLNRGTGAGYTPDKEEGATKLTYSDAKYDTYLTSVSGLKEGLVADDKGRIGAEENGDFVDYISVDGDSVDGYKVITLRKEVLGTSNISVGGTGYTLKLEGENVDNNGKIVPTTGEAWQVSGTTANLVAYTSKGYTPSSDKKKITYTADKYGDTKAMITGLKDGIAVNSADGHLGVKDSRGNFTDYNPTFDDDTDDDGNPIVVITLADELLDKKTDVNLKSSGYKLALVEPEEGDTTRKRSEDTGTWKETNSSKGAAEYTIDTNEGYRVIDDGKTITYKTKGATKATLTGLKSSSVSNGNAPSGVEVNEDNTVITLSDSALGESNIVLSGTANMVLEVDNIGMPKTENLTWDYNSAKGTITMSGTVEEGWTLSSDSKSLIHMAAVNEPKVIATISGLVKQGDLKFIYNDEEPPEITAIKGVALSQDGTSIIISKDVLGTANITLGRGENYKLDIDDTVPTETEEKTVWRISGTTATYGLVKTGYFTVDEKTNTLKYTKEKNMQTYITIQGLAKDLKVNSDNEIDGIDLDGNTITLSDSVLGDSKVTIKEANYKFGLESDVATKAKTVTKWVTSGTTATYKTYNEAYYSLSSDARTVNVTKATNGNGLATVSGGLVSGVDVNDYYNASNFTLTLPQSALQGDNKGKDITMKGGGYKLALVGSGPENVAAPVVDNYAWSSDNKGTKVTLSGDISEGWVLSDDQKITYTKAQKYVYDDEKNKVTSNAATLATISNVNTDKSVNRESTITGLDLVMDGDEVVRDANGNATIKVSGDALEGVTKTVTVGKNEPYKIVLDDSYDPPEETEKEWVTAKNNGTWTYQYEKEAGFTDSSDGKSIIYSAAATTVLATITGLIKNDTENGIYIDADASNYDGEKDTTGKTLYLHKDGETTKALEITKYPTTDALGNVTASGTITVYSDEIFSGAKLTVGKNDTYKLVVDDAIKPQSFGDEPKWYVSGTTAELKDGMTAGYEATADGKTINFVKEAPGATVAKITGLGKGIKVSTATDISDAENLESFVGAGKVGISTKVEIKDPADPSKTKKVDVFTTGITIREYGNKKGISLNQAVLGTTDINLESDDYVFLSEGDSVPKPNTTEPMFYSKNGTVTLKTITTAGFTLENDYKTYKYTKEGKKDGDVLVTISGLKKELPFDDGMPASNPTGFVSMDSNNIITIKNGALNGAKVTAKSADKNVSYTLAFADDVAQEAVNTTEWVSGSSAVYKNYDRGYYTYASLKGGGDDQTTINYVKPTNGTTYATVTGLPKDTAISEFDAQTKTITLTSEMLDPKGKTVAVKGDAYTLDVSKLDSTDDSLNSSYSGDWTVKSGSATLKGTQNAGYKLSEDAKSLVWTAKDKDNVNIATITGLNTLVSSISDTNGVITLGDDNVITDTLNKGKNVVLKGDGYTLAFEGTAASVDAGAAWTAKNGSATLSGIVHDGYSLAPDKKSLIYTKGSTTKKVNGDDVLQPLAIMTIKGVKKENTSLTGTVDVDKKKLTMNKNDLTDKVTLASGADFKFDLSDYSNGSVVGSANSDSISVSGSGVSLSTGKGDDYVDFGKSNGGNIFFYASGDGKDVIANFDDGDKLNINAAITSENIKIDDEGNAIVAVGAGSIRLDDWAKGDIKIIDKSKAETTYTWSDDLGYIVKSSGNAYVLGDIETEQTPELLKADSVSYSGGNDKK